MTSQTVAVIGGGIAGLSAAYELTKAGLRVVLFEASDRFGGKLRTETFAGRPVDLGADALLLRVPGAVTLAEELGISERIINPATSKASLFARGKLRPLAAGPILGLPSSRAALKESGILSGAQRLRTLADLFLPRSGSSGSSVADVVRRRLGDGFIDSFLDPLLGGVYAGDARRLGAMETSPQLVSHARTNRQLLSAIPSASGQAVFGSFEEGTGALIEALLSRLGGQDLRLATPVERAYVEGAEYVVETTPAGSPTRADALIVAVPAPVASRILVSLPDLAELLAGIEYASVAVVPICYESGSRPGLEGSGFLVPRNAKRFITACTFTSNKWPQPADGIIMRCSIGRIDDTRWISMTDDQIIEAVHRDLREMVGATRPPIAAKVARWPQGLPQYNVGHLERVAKIRESAARVPGLQLAGAAYDGMGIPACITSGRDAARRVMEALYVRPVRA